LLREWQSWHLFKGQIRGIINSGGTIFSVATEGNARSCIYVSKHINALPLLELCSREATIVRVRYIRGGGCEELINASAYLPYDSDEPPPTKEVRDITDYYHSRKKQLIIGCHANGHHILWGSTGTNPRGGSLMEFLVSSNLNILNHGNEPIFVACNRKEVIDLTLGTNKIGILVSNRHVTDEPSLLGHRYTSFQIGNITTNQVTFRNPTRTNWESYKDNLNVNLEITVRSIHTIRDIDRSVDQLQQAIILSNYQNCPAKTTRSPRNASCWNKTLSELKAKSRRLFNISKRALHWDTYKEALTCYNKEIRKAKRSSWRRFCHETTDIPGSATLMKMMTKQVTNSVGTIMIPDSTLKLEERL
jgi:hypothetical protein